MPYAAARLARALASHEAWQVHRGLARLEVRFDRMCHSAQVIAERLAGHGKVRALAYPGLPSHPHHALAQRQMLRGSVQGAACAAANAAAIARRRRALVLKSQGPRRAPLR